ncbi:hypothetical protein MXL46_18635 [Heyndrickxia sporothermodurans]|uniref:hypothetical protein n=1 Tax=Heyndrickxia sporothermodurans TaxID=46224 RepID=UPI002DB78CA3|nr:hypothetical protein [Heyndrickxia sporothermodurans]MEB6551069.1 hypothetical protein [Heyndrickxia sporothermodurans]
MSKYAIYSNKSYHLNIRGKILRLTSEVKESGFQELIDLAGNQRSNIFIKEVSVDDIEMAFDIKINAIYKGKEFETFSIGYFCIEENAISLFSMNYKDVELYGFKKEEQFVFKKDVSLNDIEALVEIKIPILKFEGMPKSRSLIPNQLIKEYIRKME